MTLDDYLNKYKKGECLARELGVHPSLVSQWRHGIRPIPFERIVDIERATGGKVGRKDIRPIDWQKHWPELDNKQAVNE